MSSRRSKAGATRIKSFAAVFALLVAGTLTSAPTAAAAIPASFVFGGAGWGHGVGLSQYGARGMAAAGSTAAQILTHYYTGTTVAPATDNMDIRVQVLQAATMTASTTGVMQIRTSTTDAVQVPTGTLVTFAVVSGQIKASFSTPDPLLGTVIHYVEGPTVFVEWEGTRFYNPTGAAALTTVTGSGGVYRHGRLEMGVLGGLVNAINVVRLHDEYLYGIGEMPSSWAPAALDAQAIIARGYALASVGSLKTACDCNMYDSVKSQHFTGWSKESETIGGTNYGLLWQAAVNRTSVGSTQGNVVKYGGALVTTYYYSSSGGRTQNSEDVWSATLPYLRSVADPWSLDPTNNPTYASWTRSVTQASMAAAFALTDVVSVDLSSRTAGGGVASAVATSSAGATATITGEVLRTKLALPSTWVSRPTVRIAGVDRWSTSVAVAKVASPSGKTVVIVSGQNANLVDGLVAGPLARSLAGPVLLVGSSIPPVVSTELTRRGADHAIIVGGAGAVPETVATSLAAMGLTVERISGLDRYSTAAAVALRLGSVSKTAVIASGEPGSLADALSASGPASALARPILLVRHDLVPPATATALSTLGVIGSTCIGGTGVISEPVRLSLPSCSRAAGADRYATAAAVSAAFSRAVPATDVTVTGGLDANLVDALGAGSLGHLILLAPRSAPPASVLAFLQQTPSITRLVAVGGVGAVSTLAIQGMRNA